MPAAIGSAPTPARETLGEGGIAVVYLAEQEEPVRRRVALKMIKPGMDSRQVIARFEAERQALAMMDHSWIAKVFDAETTDVGHPYFVMEYVPGLTITEHCDRHHLDIPARLDRRATWLRTLFDPWSRSTKLWARRTRPPSGGQCLTAL